MFEWLTQARDKWLLILPILIAAALPIWQWQLEYGWLDMTLGRFAWLFWITVLAWAVVVVVAIGRHRWWWLLLTAPVVLYPAFKSLALVGMCVTTGDCL